MYKKILLVLVLCGMIGSGLVFLKYFTKSKAVDIIFVREYENFAWGHQHHGMYIKRNGELRVFDISDLSDEQNNELSSMEDKIYAESLDNTNFDDGLFYSAQLYREYVLLLDSLSKLEKKIDPALVEEKMKMVEKMDPQNVMHDGNTAYDAGIMDFSVFRFDATNNRYQKILLEYSGDFSGRNISDGVTELVEFLKEF